MDNLIPYEFFKMVAGALFVYPQLIKPRKSIELITFFGKKKQRSYSYPAELFLQFLPIYQDAKKLVFKAPKKKTFPFYAPFENLSVVPYQLLDKVPAP